MGLWGADYESAVCQSEKVIICSQITKTKWRLKIYQVNQKRGPKHNHHHHHHLSAQYAEMNSKICNVPDRKANSNNRSYLSQTLTNFTNSFSA